MQASVLRRFTALLTMILLGLFSVETIIADSCDGDATPGVLAVTDGSTPASPTVPDGSSPLPQHSAHVCHCAHAHAGSLVVQRESDAKTTAPERVTGESVRVPPGPRAEPRLRPPVA